MKINKSYNWRTPNLLVTLEKPAQNSYGSTYQILWQFRWPVCYEPDEYCWHFVPHFKSILAYTVWLYTSFLVTFECVSKVSMAGASRAMKHLKPPSSFRLHVMNLIKRYSHNFIALLAYERKIYSYNEYEKCIMCSLLLPNSLRRAMLGPLGPQRIKLYQHLIIFTFLKIFNQDFW